MKYEVRVRPVVRYVVTEFRQDDDGASCCPVGEFASERYAERVAEAVRKAYAPVDGNNQFIVIREGDFTPETVAYYAQDEDEARQTAARLERETAHGWRIARRL